MSSSKGEELEQRRLLDDATKRVRDLAFLMKREMDADRLKQALDHAMEMLRELRSNVLTPKNYYELQMHVIDQLRHLEEYFMSLQRSGRPIVDIYEQVQSCNHVVPRLYLLCCVGGVYIASMEAPAKDVLKDLVEMLKGVQHPMRGLFLRSYLTQISKNRLPDVGSPYEGPGGNVQDAYNFLLQNFAETNRLWVRLQNQGAAKDRKKRSKDREDLRVLVGTNLVRLSQLEGLDMHEYKANVLPKILEEVVSCKDTIAQTYLMDCIIQVFPDDFHLATLECFLQTCATLKEKVNVRTILEAMMERLVLHVTTGMGSIPAEVPAFKLFNDCVSSIIEERATMSLVETLKLQTSLSKFALKCFPSRIDYITHCLETCNVLIENSGHKADDVSGGGADETTAQIEALLSAPLDTLALRVLEIPAYGKLMSRLPWSNWRDVALTLMKSVIKTNSILSEVEHVELLFAAITPLLKDQDGGSVGAGGGSGADDDVATHAIALPPGLKEEQQVVARCVHLIKADDTDTLLRIYVAARKAFTNGGSQRVQFTMPPLVFGALALVRRVIAREAGAANDPPTDEAPQFVTRKVFHFIIEIVNAIAAAGQAEIALKLFLMAAKSADECASTCLAHGNMTAAVASFQAIAYEFMKEALILYETDITDSKAQVRVLKAIIGTMLNCGNFSAEDYDNVTTKLCQYSNKLLKKPDQCQLVTLCSHLFWPPELIPGRAPRFADDAKMYGKSLECVKRAINIIKDKPDAKLFIEILDRCVFCDFTHSHFSSRSHSLHTHFFPPYIRFVYLYSRENPACEVKFLSGLIAHINDQLGVDAQGSAGSVVEPFYRNTLAYLRLKQQSPNAAERERFLQVEF